MKKILIFALLLAPVLILAQGGTKVGQPVINNAGWISSVGNYAYTWNAPKIIWAFNGRGDTLSQYSVVVWDQRRTLIDSAKVNGNASMTVGDSLKTVRWWNIYAEVVGTASACTLNVYGKDTIGTARTSSLVLNGLNALAFAPYYYRKLDSLRVRHATQDTIRINAVPYFSVTVVDTASSQRVAGVVQAVSQTNSLVAIMIQGLTPCKVTGASGLVLPGYYLQTSATPGYADVNLTPTVPGCGLGTVLEAGNTNKTYWIFVNTAY